MFNNIGEDSSVCLQTSHNHEKSEDCREDTYSHWQLININKSKTREIYRFTLNGISLDWSIRVINDLLLAISRCMFVSEIMKINAHISQNKFSKDINIYIKRGTSWLKRASKKLMSSSNKWATTTRITWRWAQSGSLRWSWQDRSTWKQTKK